MTTHDGAPAANLSGASVLVAGAGLAGLAAAYDLSRWGAAVTIVEARDRVGGRVFTARDGFADRQHGEAGGDMIDEEQHAIRALASDLGLPLVRILKRGWGFLTTGPRGARCRTQGTVVNGWQRLADALTAVARPYLLAEKRWDTPIAALLGRRSVAQWLEDTHADKGLRDTVVGLRGFFLADPEELSLLALIDQFSHDDASIGRMYRIAGGNDRLATTLAARLGDRVRCGAEVLAVSERGRGVRVAVKHGRQTAQISVDYVVLALPATLVRRIPFTPALPPRQHEAIARLKYGRGTKTLLQFPRRFWNGRGRPQAFGSALPFGAAWDANEEQHGRHGILALLAGGSASDATADIVAKENVTGLARRLDCLGSRGIDVTAWQQFRWESDPWARGGYAVFDPAFDAPLRDWLARPHGRVFFAGEHTSIAWQGYMNGAVESGRRAAAEIAATHQLSGPTVR
jgi:monoamine oxidase